MHRPWRASPLRPSFIPDDGDSCSAARSQIRLQVARLKRLGSLNRSASGPISPDFDLLRAVIDGSLGHLRSAEGWPDNWPITSSSKTRTGSLFMLEVAWYLDRPSAERFSL
jgi:hypothetical protein